MYAHCNEQYTSICMSSTCAFLVQCHDNDILVYMFLLHLHEIVEGLYFHYSLCVCVCVSVCEQNADRTATPILTQSSLNSLVTYCSRSNPIEIALLVTLGLGQSHSDAISIFLSQFSVDIPYFGFQSSYVRTK